MFEKLKSIFKPSREAQKHIKVLVIEDTELTSVWLVRLLNGADIRP